MSKPSKDRLDREPIMVMIRDKILIQAEDQIYKKISNLYISRVRKKIWHQIYDQVYEQVQQQVAGEISLQLVFRKGIQS